MKGSGEGGVVAPTLSHPVVDTGGVYLRAALEGGEI